MAVGLTREQTVQLRRGEATFDPVLDTLIRLVRQVAAEKGTVSDQAWSGARTAGWTVPEVLEAFGWVVATVFTNFFNHLVGTELEVAAAPDLEPSLAATGAVG